MDDAGANGDARRKAARRASTGSVQRDRYLRRGEGTPRVELPEQFSTLPLDQLTLLAERDADQILDLAAASDLLLGRVRDGSFRLDPDTSDELNQLIALHESIDPGVRRTASSVNADGRGITVHVMGDSFQAFDRAELVVAEQMLRTSTEIIGHPVLREVTYAALATYAQMYFDGNKRTARYVMDGDLMANGFDAVAIPAARRTEYHETIAALFRRADTVPYARFLLDVAHRGDPV